MAKRVPRRKAGREARERTDAERLLEFLDEIGPRPELADAIEKVYLERKRAREEAERGPPKRRRSTRA